VCDYVCVCESVSVRAFVVCVVCACVYFECVRVCVWSCARTCECSTRVSVCQCLCVSVFQYICVCVCVCVSVCLCVCVYVYLCASMSLSSSVVLLCLSACLCFYLLFVCGFVYLVQIAQKRMENDHVQLIAAVCV